jgi:glucose/arabinose dehydrogenase
LRINKDGSVPDDNPFAGSAVWSLGHRNPQGIAWHPVTGELYATEHGPSGFDGPGGGDEVNRIVKGANYGWPVVSHERSREGMISPLLVFTPAEAPASAAFYSGERISQFSNNFFFGALRGEGLWRVIFSQTEPDRILYKEKMFGGKYGRIRDVVIGHDGNLYFTTSNRDGRGEPVKSDDRIMRVRAE